MAYNNKFDYIVLGAGIYGMYLSYRLAQKYSNKTILLLEKDVDPFLRASYINQARVHNGYHYPRSLHTALKSTKYYQKFSEDFGFAINGKFKKIYAISNRFSHASADDFKRFCNIVGIPCTETQSSTYFKDDVVESAFLTEETSMDAKIIVKYLQEKINDYKNIKVKYNFDLLAVEHNDTSYTLVNKSDNTKYTSEFVVNTTYASVNQVIEKFGYDKFSIKYEIAELCLCDVSSNIKKVGLTVMDGPFFSLMPFGKTGYHSLSSVHFTPHKTSYEKLPKFNCMQGTNCSPLQLENCNLCINKPKTKWNKMSQLSKKYLINDIKYKFSESLVAIKPILKISEVSDSRPTVIHKHSQNPYFISVLSGKFNTIYDLEELL